MSDALPSLTEFELQLVSFLDQQYQLTGVLLTADKALKEFGIPVGEFKRAFEKEQVKNALTERGVVFERFNEDWTAKSLTPIQLLVANSLLDLTDTRTQKKKLQDLGVGTVTYNAWLRDPVFKDYLHRRAEQLIGDNQHEVDTALLDRVRAGDLKAIAYYNEYTGRFTQQSRTQSANIDVGSVIVKILEIIDEVVTAPSEKREISIKLKQLIAQRQVASGLMGAVEEDPIVVPEVVKLSSIEAPKDANVK